MSAAYNDMTREFQKSSGHSLMEEPLLSVLSCNTRLNIEQPQLPE